MATTTYLIAAGSNRRGRHGDPAAEVRAALAGLAPRRCAPVIASAPLGPSIRRFANTVALVDSDLAPPAMLAWLKQVEQAFGRRRGQRWGARVIDLDIVLWSGGCWRSRDLVIPHRGFRDRGFVLQPSLAVAPGWRDPVTGLSMRQLAARLTRPRPVPRSARAGAGP